MNTHGLELTLASLHRQLASMPWPRYELRLIGQAGRECVATRYWTARQLLDPQVVGFLRARNRDGCDVYFRPYAPAHNAGYILLDFDHGACPLSSMRAAAHTPCVIVETSPGRQQAWVRISLRPVSPTWATMVARCLAQRYGADAASAEWRHLGRLAGFTNRKSNRIQANGLPPWVQTVWHAMPSLARVDDLGNAAQRPDPPPTDSAPMHWWASWGTYRRCLQALRLCERYPAPDWSIADYRVASWLLRHGYGSSQVEEILRQGSPGFPRRHPLPDDYLRRTLQAAAASLQIDPAFSARPFPPRG